MAWVRAWVLLTFTKTFRLCEQEGASYKPGQSLLAQKAQGG